MDSPHAFSRQAKDLRNQCRWREADSLLIAGLERYPDDVFLWNQRIALHKRQPDRAWEAFVAMQQACVRGNVVTYSILIDAFGKAQQPDRAWETFVAMQQAGIRGNVVTYNTLINAFGKAQQPDRAWQAFWVMQQAGIRGDVVTYSTLIDAFGKAQQPDRAWEAFVAMQQACVRGNVVTYSTLIDAFGKAQQPDRAWQVFMAMQQAGIRGNVVTYNTLIDAYYNAGQWQRGIEALESLVLPIESQPRLAELYRKAKRYDVAIETCERVLRHATGSSEVRDRAWIVRLYALLHTDREEFAKQIAAPPFGESSVHAVRLICARVFGGIVSANTSDATRVANELRRQIRTRDLGVAARQDINNAMRILGY